MFSVLVAAEQPFDRFLRERVFTPLGMKDTGFFVPKEKIDRFAANYGAGLRVSELCALQLDQVGFDLFETLLGFNKKLLDGLLRR